MRRLNARGISRLVAAIVIIVVLAVAGGAYYILTGAQPPPPRQKTALTYGTSWDFTTLDPSTEFDISSKILCNVYDTLLYFDSPTRKLIPVLATSWESNEEATIWTFHLRQGVKFHDGSQFNASAVKYSIERTIQMAAGPAYIWAAVSEINVLDDYTVEFRLKYPVALDYVASAGYGAFIMSPSAPNTPEWLNVGHESGSGPYKLVSYDPTSKAVLEKSEDWWGWKEPNYPRANPKAPDIYIMTVVRDYLTQETQVVAGDVDVVEDVPLEDVQTLRANPSLLIHEFPTFRNLHFFLNTKKAPLNNSLVRLAIAHAIDYNAVVKVARSGYGSVASGPLPIGFPGHSDDFRYEYDLARAKDLLTKAGYSEATQWPSLLFTYTTGDLAEKKTAEVIKANLAALGIDVEIRPMIHTDRLSLSQSGWKNPEAVQDLTLWYWWPTIVSPYDYLWALYYDHGTENPWNSGYYDDTRFSQLIDEALATEGKDWDKAMQMYHEAQKIIYDQIPGISLLDLTRVVLYRQGLENIERAVDPMYETVLFAQVIGVEAARTTAAVLLPIELVARMAEGMKSVPVRWT